MRDLTECGGGTRENLAEIEVGTCRGRRGSERRPDAVVTVVI